MEVHHHSHHPKKWKEYITEFVMLFTAVTLGFFAENLREHQIVEKHKVQNLTAMADDLKQDSASIEARIKDYSKTLAQFEEIKDLSLAYQQNKINENDYIDSVLNKYLSANYGVALFINNASYKNTIAAGSLGYIKENETKMLIAQYYEALYGKLLVNNNILDVDVNEFMSKTFCFGYMSKKIEKLDIQTRNNVEQIEDFKTIPSLRKELTAPEFRMYVNKIEGRCGYYLYVMETAKKLNNNLLAQLKKEAY
jgi:hypothetical protein